MVYLLVGAGLPLLVLNVRTSWLVLQSALHTKSQKAMQILFVWLVPYAGSAITAAVHNGTIENQNPGSPWNEGGFAHGADGGLHGDVDVPHALHHSDCY